MAYLDLIPNWILFIGIIIAGIFAFMGQWDKRSKEKQEAQDKGEDRLITILEKTVKELETKVNKQSADIETLGKRITELEEENKTLVKVLQGRDEQTQKFYEKGFEAMNKMDKMLPIVEDIKIMVDGKNKTIDKFIDLMQNNTNKVVEAAKIPTHE